MSNNKFPLKASRQLQYTYACETHIIINFTFFRSVNDLRLNCTNKSDINVYIGSVESAKKGTKLSISNFKVHESYDAFTVINNDIAVIKLNISNSTLNSLLGKTINPICLANSKTTIKPGNYYVGSGWGKLGKKQEYSRM